MICNYCSLAGSVQALNTDENGMSVLRELTCAIAKLHHQCPKGTWCDCQCILGQLGTSERAGK